MLRTAYLFPLSVRALIGTALTLFGAGPRRWWRCAAAAFRAGSATLGERARFLMLILFGAELAWLARRQGWRHVHVHSCADSANIALFAHLLTGVTYSLTLHGMLDNYGANQKQKWGNAAFAIVVARELESQIEAALHADLPPVVDVAPMGVDLNAFRRAQPFVPWPGIGVCRIFACGRLTPSKRHEDIVQALALLREHGIECELRIAGEEDAGGGGYRALLENLIVQMNLEDRVHLLGAVSETIIRHELEAAHLFVLASELEAMPVVVLEAMAMEVPVVVTSVGGLTELVDHEVHGLVVEPQRVAELARAMLRILRDPALARRLVAAARQRVETSFHSGVSAAVITERVRALTPP